MADAAVNVPITVRNAATGDISTVIQLPSVATVRTIKLFIQQQFDVPLYTQRLLQGDWILDDDDNVEALQLPHEVQLIRMPYITDMGDQLLQAVNRGEIMGVE